MVFNRDAVLKVIVGVHYASTSMVLLASWLPMSYTVNQITIIILGLWGIVRRESVIQIELLMLIKFFSILFDIIAIGMYFELGRDGYRWDNMSSYFVLSAFFAIFLLILKPLMLLLLNQVRKDRDADGTAPIFGQWSLHDGHVPGYTPVE